MSRKKHNSSQRLCPNCKRVKIAEQEMPEPEKGRERIFVTFTDDFIINEKDKELCITINIEFALDVPLDGSFNTDDIITLKPELVSFREFED